MKVETVSSVNFRNNSIPFGGKSKKDENAGITAYSSGTSNSAIKKVPVIVLLAMNPATLNSKIPTMPETDNPNKITILAPETKSSDALTYVISPKIEGVEQSDPPFGWAYLSDGIQIQQVIKGKSPFSSYNMLYTKYTESGNPMDVKNVYIISADEKKSNNPLIHPPKVVKIVYHNIGDEKEYCGAVVEQYYLDNNGNSKGSFTREIRMDKNSAQSLIYLISGHTKWNYKGPIEFEETTKPNTIY